MSKGKKYKGRAKVREDLEARIVLAGALLVDLESELTEVKKDLEQLVADWREVNDEMSGL